MKSLVLSILLYTLVSASCSKGNETAIDTYEYFSTHLEANMNYSNIVSAFGEPEQDIGSGIHIYVYKLKDGTTIWIGYTDTILYARHMDSNQQLLHIII